MRKNIIFQENNTLKLPFAKNEVFTLMKDNFDKDDL